MPQNALENPLVLPILGLLVERPRHQYALLNELRTRYPFLQAKTSTVYTLVQSLVRQGLVDLDDASEGGASDHHQVALTTAGVADLERRVQRDLLQADPNADPRFTIALAYIGVLTAERASSVLRERADQLRAERHALTDTLNGTELHELHMIEGHFLASRLKHDAAWLARLANRIARGTFDWPGAE